MDPSNFHEPPEDVQRDQALKAPVDDAPERLVIPPTDLRKEAEETAEMARKLRERVEEAREEIEKTPVAVSVGKSGNIRKNGPCPCGSGSKYKRCCLEQVRAGKLGAISVKGWKRRMFTEYEPPKAVRKRLKDVERRQPPTEETNDS
jgi:hypothetical protein